MINRMIIKPMSCTCLGCKHVFEVANEPGRRFGKSRKKYKGSGNKHRDKEFHRWVRSIRRRDPLRDDLPKEYAIGYTD